MCTAYVHASAMAYTRQDMRVHSPSFNPKLFTSVGTSYYNYHKSDTAVGSKRAHKVIQCDKLSALYVKNMCRKFQHKQILHVS